MGRPFQSAGWFIAFSVGRFLIDGVDVQKIDKKYQWHVYINEVCNLYTPNSAL
jgi:hypothetical protein